MFREQQEKFFGVVEAFQQGLAKRTIVITMHRSEKAAMARSREPREWSWPGGARIAISIGLALEEFQWASQYVQVPRPGQVDRFSLSYSDYGRRVGIWRLLDLLDEFGVKANMSTNGLVAERFPQVVRAVADAGHEINGHGWVNDVLPDLADRDAERQDIRRCTAALTEAAGVAPVGWTSPGSAGSDNKYQILVEEGYIWNGDEAADDIPYLHETNAGTLAMLPRTNTLLNDLVMWIWGKNPPSIIWEGFKDTFDELYREGTDGYPKWTEIVLHAHMAGRPTLIPTIRKCLEYAQRHEGVWIAPRREIALWTQEREGVTLGRMAG